MIVFEPLDVEALVQTGATTLAAPDTAPARPSTRDLSALFGIDLVDEIPATKPPARPVRVGREYLKVLGIAPRIIDAWLREDVLVETAERHTYERPPRGRSTYRRHFGAVRRIRDSQP